MQRETSGGTRLTILLPLEAGKRNGAL
jgi:hypothetical protein